MWHAENKLLSTDYEQTVQMKHLHVFMTEVCHSQFNPAWDMKLILGIPV